jgi:transcriptional regulator with XRE-family HTH domain
MADKFETCLTQIRKSKGLSQSELADRIGVKTAAICHFETGFRKPTFDHLLKLAEVLGISSVDYLLGKEASRATSATDKLVRDFGRLSLKDQATIKEMIKFLLKKK